MRIRSVKPEFWVSESIGRLSREARLLFIGLWSFADDSGRSRGAFPAISGALFPYDDDALQMLPEWFAELEREGMVFRYKAEDGNTYYQLPNWLKHQKIEKPSASKFPAFTESSPNIHRILPDPYPLDQGSGIRDQGPMEQVDVEPVFVAIAPASEVDRPVRQKFQKPTEDEMNQHAIEIGLPQAEVFAFWNYYESNGWRVGKNPMKSWRGAMGSWKARNDAKGTASVAPASHANGVSPSMRAMLLSKELEGVNARISKIENSYDGHQTWDQNDIATRKILKQQKAKIESDIKALTGRTE